MGPRSSEADSRSHVGFPQIIRFTEVVVPWEARLHAKNGPLDRFLNAWTVLKEIIRRKLIFSKNTEKAPIFCAFSYVLRFWKIASLVSKIKL